jgi:hypothetical protein
MSTRFTKLISRIKAAIWKALLTDQVRPYIWIYYVPLWIWGIYGAFFAAPPTSVLPVMGNTVYDLWIWAIVIATSIVMCSMYVEGRAGARTDILRDRLIRASIRLQISGHVCMFLVLTAFEISAIDMTSWGQGDHAFTIFALSPYVVGCSLLVAQGLARLHDMDGEL